MACLLFTCPNTNLKVPTGVEMDVQGLRAHWKSTLKLDCSHCDDVHDVSVRDVYLNSAVEGLDPVATATFIVQDFHSDQITGPLPTRRAPLTLPGSPERQERQLLRNVAPVRCPERTGLIPLAWTPSFTFTQDKEHAMCDYSLTSVKSRPAAIGDKLVTNNFGTGTIGFADASTRNPAAICDTTAIAVCVLPGTEIAFDDPIATGPWLQSSQAVHGPARDLPAGGQGGANAASRRARTPGRRDRQAGDVANRSTCDRAAAAGGAEDRSRGERAAAHRVRRLTGFDGCVRLAGKPMLRNYATNS